ncbi:aminoglycoside phosphotransferase family protein [Bacillus salacetis]|uniref:Aminoglycoside phosphotransferase family protein n=1 Tax=Bacillus salacetis TaxID=2315464 RepID=A0A3A1QT08_9BACI|nr:aminoglycoside phosphotransferase family protein [Bacillus salacetis]RIW30368.1 aminoglycoside phosphotransferase family protein [Bacillus salacetis]
MKLGNPIARGNTAEIFLNNNKIIKLFNDHLPETEASKEAEKQRFVHSCGISVPAILDVTTIEGKQAIIMEYAEGKTLGDLFFEDTENQEHYLKISVDIQQKIHGIISPSIEPMAGKLHRQINDAHQLKPEQKLFLNKKLNSMSYENRLCHGDFHLFNLIMKDEGAVILDWVDASAGDFRADVYRTYLLYSQLSQDIAESYLKLYCKRSGILRSEVLDWAPIIAGARLSENVSSENEDRLIAIVKDGCSSRQDR